MPVLQNGELVLYGFVGDNLWDEGFTAREVLEALADVGRDADVVVRLNSGGGYVDEGIAIYNALAAHRGAVSVHVDAVAASSASLIAMAGNAITMHAGSMMMVHDPAGATVGTAADHAKAQSTLEKWATQFVGIYAERTGKDPGAVREIMQAETWMTADEAVAEGFADSVEAAKAKPVAAFDFRAYAHAPQRLVALSERKGWSQPQPNAVASAPAPTRQNGEAPMTDTPKADVPTADLDKIRAEAVTADRARRAAILALDEAKGREALAEHLYTTELSIDDVKAALAAAPVAKAEPPAEPPVETPEAYAAERATAAGLAAPSVPVASAAKAGWAKAAARINNRH